LLLRWAYPEDYDSMIEKIRNYDLEAACRILKAASAKRLTAPAEVGTAN
jgi:hypothetical protein